MFALGLAHFLLAFPGTHVAVVAPEPKVSPAFPAGWD